MLELVLLLVSIALFIAAILLAKKALGLKKELQQLSFEKSSQSVRYGKLTEQFVPFIENFPYEPANFRFLGSPIDGVLFDENEIVFCEFKAGGSTLNENQRKIKQLVESKKIKWLEFRLR